jgi:predicted dehydrogenase
LTFFHENAGEAIEIAMPDPVAAPNQVTADDRLTAADQALGKGHQAQLADFVNAVRTGEPVRVGTTEARTSLSVILALYASAASGRPVRL